MTDEDRKYLMEIEKQKLKREEIVRRKEWKWNILEGKRTVKLSRWVPRIL